MFAGTSNLFYPHKDINTLFHTVNKQLIKVNHWFRTNKLSLNVKKTKNQLITWNNKTFHKPSTKDDQPLKISELVISSKLIEQKSFVKFLGVILDEYISWKDHIWQVENKIAKNIGLLCRAKHLCNTSSIKSIYFSYIIHILT